MHDEARAGMARMIEASGIDLSGRLDALDMGGVDINGTTRDLFPQARWTGLDIEDGPGVDVVADAATWQTKRRFDIVTCTELLEHVEDWRGCIGTAHGVLKRGGYLFITAASTGRYPHGARGGPSPLPGEWYTNIAPDALTVALAAFSMSHVEFNPNPGDVYAWARK
jgi:hypothetical protein